MRQGHQEFDRAETAAGDGAILNAHAAWLCERGDSARADAEFNLALRDARYRTPVQSLVNAGKCARNTGQWSRAEGYLRRALLVLPRDPQVLYMLADVELKQGTIMEAQAFIQRRDALGADGATLDLAARIEDADGNRLAVQNTGRPQDRGSDLSAHWEGVRGHDSESFQEDLVEDPIGRVSHAAKKSRWRRESAHE